ncbi:MAG: hypothetical protein GPOALKHO_000402 [Sodalis sp.]|nr:MAG: hypothetical protein GPOALKHO_000402 [Sodalis sp.]
METGEYRLRIFSVADIGLLNQRNQIAQLLADVSGLLGGVRCRAVSLMSFSYLSMLIGTIFCSIGWFHRHSKRGSAHARGSLASTPSGAFIVTVEHREPNGALLKLIVQPQQGNKTYQPQHEPENLRNLQQVADIIWPDATIIDGIAQRQAHRRLNPISYRRRGCPPAMCQTSRGFGNDRTDVKVQLT